MKQLSKFIFRIRKLQKNKFIIAQLFYFDNCPRLVNPDRTRSQAVSEIEISEAGRVVWLKDFGLVKVFRIENHRRHNGTLGNEQNRNERA